MRQMMLLLCVLSLVMLRAVAQPDPDGGQPADNRRQPAQGNRNAGAMQANAARLLGEQRTEMLRAPQGLFLLRNGVLARYHAVNLEEQGLLDLFPPARAAAGAAARRAAAARAPEQDFTRMLPATLLADGRDLLILIGDNFFRVDAETLEVKVRTVLQVPGRPAQPEMARLALFAAPVTLDRDPATPFLYVARGSQLMIVNVDTGQVMAEVQLPAQMTPQRPDPQQRQQRAAGADAREAQQVTVIGQLVRQGWKDHAVWALRDEGGEEYLLRGAQLAQLVKTPEIEGKRVRVTGALVTQGGGNAAQKVLEIATFQVLP